MAVAALALILIFCGLAIIGVRIFHRAERFSTPLASPVLRILVLIRNQEHHIEGLIRNLADTLQRTALTDSELLLVDLDSGDETPLILQRLTRQYDYMHLMQLPKGEATALGEVGCFFERNPVAILIDLRGQVDLRQTIQRLLFDYHKKENEMKMQKSSL